MLSVWKSQAQRHSAAVRVQALHGSHVSDGGAEGLQALPRQALYRHLLLEGVQRDAAVHPGVAVRRQYMVCARRVVADALRGPAAQEHAARVVQQRQPLLLPTAETLGVVVKQKP